MQVTWKLSQPFPCHLMSNAFNCSFLLTICSVWHDSVWFCFIWIDQVTLGHVKFISKSWGQIFLFATISSLKSNCYRGSLGVKQLRCYAKKKIITISLHLGQKVRERSELHLNNTDKSHFLWNVCGTYIWNRGCGGISNDTADIFKILKVTTP